MMNDLSRFRALRKQILPWDFIAWDGTGFVSDGIEFVERASVSHISWVLDPSRPIDGEKQEGFDIIEATIENGKNGVQINALDDRIANYDPGGRVWLLSLSRHMRQILDFEAMFAYALSRRGDHYSIKSIADFILRKVPVIGYLPVFHKPDPHGEVCSEYAAEILRAGGLPGIEPHECDPQKFCQMKLWGVGEHGLKVEDLAHVAGQ
jgi:hypothetical protein